MLQFCELSSKRPKRPTRPRREAPSAPQTLERCPYLLLHGAPTARHSLRFLHSSFFFQHISWALAGWALGRWRGRAVGPPAAGGRGGRWRTRHGVTLTARDRRRLAASRTGDLPESSRGGRPAVASAEGWSELLAHQLRDSRSVAHAQGGGRASAAAPAQPQQQLLQSSD